VKILLITPVPPAARGPGAMPALLHATLVGLSEHHDVTIATSPGPEPWELEAVAALVRDGYEVCSVERHLRDGIHRWTRRARLAGTWLCAREPWRTTWYREPRMQSLLDSLLEARAFDVVAVEDNAMASYRLRTDAALVLTEYEVRKPRKIDWRAGPIPEWPAWCFREIDWRRWPTYQRRVWPQFDAVQVFTTRDFESATQLLPTLRDRLHVNPFGIDLPDLSATVSEEPNTIGFVANYTHAPNVDAAIWLACEILPRVRQRLPQARLRLAGSHAPANIRGLASRDVEFVGFKDDVDAFQRSCTVLAAPVRTGGGMRMKILQAMALEKPVVTTSRGAEGLSWNGADPPVIVANDAEKQARSIGDLLTDCEARTVLARRARAHVEQYFSAPSYAQRLEAIYRAARAARVHHGAVPS
jgi:glycosyltransferase involved in cell wall biosynthesis